jgi:hypothetical protein
MLRHPLQGPGKRFHLARASSQMADSRRTNAMGNAAFGSSFSAGGGPCAESRCHVPPPSCWLHVERCLFVSAWSSARHRVSPGLRLERKRLPVMPCRGRSARFWARLPRLSLNPPASRDDVSGMFRSSRHFFLDCFVSVCGEFHTGEKKVGWELGKGSFGGIRPPATHYRLPPSAASNDVWCKRECLKSESAHHSFPRSGLALERAVRNPTWDVSRETLPFPPAWLTKGLLLARPSPTLF